MQFEPIKIPIVKIESHGIWRYDYFEYPSKRQLEKNSKSFAEGKARVYSLFGLKSRKRLAHTLENWVTTVDLASRIFHIRNVKPLNQHTFATLTLSSNQLHCDKEIKRKAFNYFLVYAKRKWHINNYIWKAEPQKNGNIHFHILLDRFIPYKELRIIWNKAQEQLQYITEFKKIHGHENPNSTDIHSLRKVKNISSYIIKYMKKDEAFRPICGHTWGRSDNMRELKGITIEEDYQTRKWIEKEVKENEAYQYQNEFCQINHLKNKINFKGLSKHQLVRIREQVLDNYHKLNRI